MTSSANTDRKNLADSPKIQFFSRATQVVSFQLTSSDSETAVEVVDESEDGSVELERHPVRGDEAGHGNEDDEGGVEPVDMLVPVGPRHGQLGNVRLLGPGLLLNTGSPQRLVIRRAIGEGIDARRLGRHVGGYPD